MAPTSVIIIGAGWSGLAAAATYLQIKPSINLNILDASESPGGVWSKSRLYPGLVANSPSGLYEYSDLSMVDDKHPAYDLITGERVQEYLEQYARVKGIYDKIRFGVDVISAKRRGDSGSPSGWDVEILGGEVLSCDKLIVASGLHSKLKLPKIPQEGYTGVASIHSKYLGVRHGEITSDPSVKSVVVVGGCKSAVEASSVFLSAGQKVHWIVRPSPQGVPIVVLNKDAKPNLIAANNTRLFSIFSPSIFDTTSFWYKFLHKKTSGLGGHMLSFFWKGMTKVVKSGAKYDTSANSRKIEPEGTNFFYDSAYISVLYDSAPFLRWIHDESRVEVHRARPLRLAGRTMELEDGTTVPADAVIWCTGWQPSIDFFDEEESLRLGVPMRTERLAPEEEKKWSNLSAAADKHVTDLLPLLKASGRPPQETPEYTQFHLYRQVLSPRLLASDDHSIAFTGFVSSSQTSFCSELLALWSVAWLEDILPASAIPSEAAMEESVAQVNAWMSRRYGARGAKDPEIIMEIQTFFDTLMTDLGLVAQRKRMRGGLLGWVREWVQPYRARDYAGVVDEFMEGVRRRKERDEE